MFSFLLLVPNHCPTFLHKSIQIWNSSSDDIISHFPLGNHLLTQHHFSSFLAPSLFLHYYAHYILDNFNIVSCWIFQYTGLSAPWPPLLQTSHTPSYLSNWLWWSYPHVPVFTKNLIPLRILISSISISDYYFFSCLFGTTAFVSTYIVLLYSISLSCLQK